MCAHVRGRWSCVWGLGPYPCTRVSRTRGCDIVDECDGARVRVRGCATLVPALCHLWELFPSLARFSSALLSLPEPPARRGRLAKQRGRRRRGKFLLCFPGTRKVLTVENLRPRRFPTANLSSLPGPRSPRDGRKDSPSLPHQASWPPARISAPGQGGGPAALLQKSLGASHPGARGRGSMPGGGLRAYGPCRALVLVLVARRAGRWGRLGAGIGARIRLGAPADGAHGEGPRGAGAAAQQDPRQAQHRTAQHQPAQRHAPHASCMHRPALPCPAHGQHGGAARENFPSSKTLRERERGAASSIRGGWIWGWSCLEQGQVRS